MGSLQPSKEQNTPHQRQSQPRKRCAPHSSFQQRQCRSSCAVPVLSVPLYKDRNNHDPGERLYDSLYYAHNDRGPYARGQPSCSGQSQKQWQGTRQQHWCCSTKLQPVCHPRKQPGSSAGTCAPRRQPSTPPPPTGQHGHGQLR